MPLNRSAVPKVLVVDDEADLRDLVELTLVRMGLDVESAASVAEARAKLASTAYDLCLTDMRLPDGTGLDVVAGIHAAGLDIPVAVITAYGSADNAVAALKAGAFDYLSKPIGLDQLRTLVKSALDIPAVPPPRSRGTTNLAVGAEVAIIGQAPAFDAVRGLIVKVAKSMAPVHITGESGSGKELAARSIHAQSPRAGKPFIAVNCGAIPETLMESEFFGYKKGAFTGAAEDRDGFFKAAHGGTLFLDEVADLPLAMQVKLLRAIQEKSVRKVGATSEEPVDVRILSATHKHLASAVESGLFRQDLYYRLNVIEVRMPSLRECREDVPQMAAGILARQVARQGGADDVRLTATALRALEQYDFPGNVRELENILERAVALAGSAVIDVADLCLTPIVQALVARRETESIERIDPSESVTAQSSSEVMPEELHPEGVSTDGSSKFVPGLPLAAWLALPLKAPLQEYLDVVERAALEEALVAARYNRTRAAEKLGLTFRSLRYRLKRLNIE